MVKTDVAMVLLDGADASESFRIAVERFQNDLQRIAGSFGGVVSVVVRGDGDGGRYGPPRTTVEARVIWGT